MIIIDSMASVVIAVTCIIVMIIVVIVVMVVMAVMAVMDRREIVIAAAVSENVSGVDDLGLELISFGIRGFLEGLSGLIDVLEFNSDNIIEFSQSISR